MLLRSSESVVVQRPQPGDPLFAVVLAESLGWPATESAVEVRERLAEFCDDAARRSLRVEALAALDAAERLIGAAASIESPGHAALLMVPFETGGPQSQAAAGVLFSAALDAWRRQGVRLGQLLLPCPARQAEEIALKAGFRFLTRLAYMERTADQGLLETSRLPEVEWLAYSPASEHRFLSTIEATYGQSLDCPELTGTRPVRDVLVGHRAAGEFDPQLWWLAMRGDEAVGVLLLAGIPRQRALEVVYMGVTQPARRAGVAHALLERACRLAAGRGAHSLTLAVDERNSPARRLYEKWGFVRFAMRAAWIVTLDETDTCDPIGQNRTPPGGRGRERGGPPRAP